VKTAPQLSKALGATVLRTEDPRLLTGRGRYIADLADPLLDGAHHVVFVRSTVAHGTIEAIDVDDARGADGVVAVFTADDVDLGPVPAPVPICPPQMAAPVLAQERVRYVGEPIAAVIAPTVAQAMDAAELVVVRIDPLPVVMGPENAARDDVLLFPDVGTNVASQFEVGDGLDGLFDDCEVVVRQRIAVPRLAACPLEGRVCASAWDDDGRLHHWLSVQAPHTVKGTMARMFGLEPEHIHVIAPDMGGGFGPKISGYPEDVFVAWAARRLGRPLRWTETRSENLVGLHHGRGQVIDVAIGGTRDGRIDAYSIEVFGDAGAYTSLGAYTVSATLRMTTGAYAIPRASGRGRGLVTNTTPTSAYRGAGRPESANAIERAVDRFAFEIGVDPLAVRRRNLISPHAFPYTTPVGTQYDCGDYATALDCVVERIDYDALRAEQAARSQRGDRLQLGIGVIAYVESTAAPVPGSELGRVEVLRDGQVTVLTGTAPQGQGHETTWAWLAASELGVPIDAVTVMAGDTDAVPSGVGTFGSRSLQLGGMAVVVAAREVSARAREIAASLLEANPDDVVVDDERGQFHVAGTPAVSVGWDAVVDAAGPDGLAVTHQFAPEAATFPFGAHAAVVELDVDTGAVRLVRMVTVDDAGNVVHPAIVEGQRHGGIAQGAAQALLEEFRYDDDGNPLTTNLMDYLMISAPELPSFELLTLETPTPVNPLGVKGIGESGTTGSIAAVHNAVCDVLAQFGIAHLDLPATPERVWRALRDAGVS
jgi:carbon-monoxide dehydrogenase large subunit